ncbi:lysophospholipid acyltransferase family protein [Thiomicrorhabdus lithotrophica]|uniref:1-acyl-sn-glycerol-3-phosphate acyltransferase n=1 Tax=Thiomicrorhabdus lithotrophica TaxID=2949997 RepID=A0ABY8CEZ4_9GAMM|nr:lysophospholipid acyltransferase family protein [Thiomicrorhabdus lithotrophica]WEJ63076.1 1-acyl-sn-glycerol-3-phosphate acyltransferase [Thiomicrorhabdus lithotrophica]
MKIIWFLRSVLFALGQVTTLVFFSLLGQLTRPFSFATRYQFMHYWAKFCLVWVRWTCGVKYSVHGADNIDRQNAGLILARHESAWETLAFQAIFPRQAYVLKRELLKIPFFGWGMALLNPIAIDRGAGRKALNQLVKEGTARLQKGDWVVVFPEGTRMPAGELGKINIGGAMLATKSKAPVYLVAHNAGSYWPKNSFIKTPGTIDVYISPPLDVADMSASEVNQQVENWLSQHLTSTETKGAKEETVQPQ